MGATGRGLRRLVAISCRRPALTLAVGLTLAVVSIAYAFAALRLNTSQRALLPAHEPYIQRSIAYDREFGVVDKLVIAVEAPSVADAQAYADRLVQELRSRRVPLRRIVYRVDPKQFEGHGLLYLSTDRLREIRGQILDHQEFMETFASRPTLDRLIAGVAQAIARGFVTGLFDLGLSESKNAGDLSFVRDVIAQISAHLDGPAPYRSPWGALFPGGGIDESTTGYFLSDDERLLFILAEPDSGSGSFTDNDRPAVDGTRAAIADLRAQFPRVNVGVTGAPALEHDEMTSAFEDSRVATAVAVVFTLVLLLVAFRRIRRPLIMLAILAVSQCWAIGVATLVVGHLSLFSVMFVSIVIGIGIDYGIYYLFRYEEERRHGRTLGEALELTAARSGPGMLVGALTAAGAFYVLVLTDFRGLQELGVIAGSAILLAWLAMMTLFPAALVLADRGHAAAAPGAVSRPRVRVPFVEHALRYPKTVIIVVAVVTLVSLYGLRAVRFDYDLLNLQAKGTESVVWERRILATAGRSDFVALSRASSLEDLERKRAAFQKLASVADVDSILMFLPEDQAEKLALIEAFAPLVAPIRLAPATPADPDGLVAALTILERRLRIAAAEAPAGATRVDLERTRDAVTGLLDKLRRMDRATIRPALTRLQNELYRDFARSFHRLQANLAPRPAGLDDVPPAIRAEWVSDRGGFLLQIHPAVDIWDRAGASRFVTELRTVDPHITGNAVITFEAIRSMERAYQQGTIYAIVMVTVVAALMLTRVRETVLSLLPLGLGLTWTVGLMGLFGIRFTMGNVFALPLILGAAAEYGLNILLRFLEDGRQRGLIVGLSTMQGVLVSGLTTITGFGSLMVADHRGIFGLGLLLTIGTAASLAAALVVLPVLLGRENGPTRPRMAHGEAVALVLVLCLGVIPVPPAAAHAVIVEASLGERAIAPGRATVVRLRFNAALEPRFTRATLREPGGRESALAARAGARREEVVVELPPLEAGRYVLRYKVLAADGHLTEDIVRFRVAAEE